jgi:uncharacterized membrane protein YeaQ/YmgE (transglycosylase-associated protein family)
MLAWHAAKLWTDMREILRLGLIAGFVGSRIINRTGEGKLLDILLGVMGAVLARWLFNIYRISGVTAANSKTLGK